MAGRASVSRRALLGVGGAGVLAGAAGLLRAGHGSDEDKTDPGTVPFHGVHQAGIATPVQDRLHFAAFDLTTDDPARVVVLLRAWTEAAAAMTRGAPVGDGAVGGAPLAPPDDTGEALGLPASRLTLTVGFGRSFFTRLGLADRRPKALVDLPHFPGDRLEEARSGGDLCVQACADDPQVAVHAVRNLARIGFGTVSVRWSQLGFGKTSSTTPDSQTPRNLMGFKDGTANIPGTDADLLAEHVWAAEEDGTPWMAGGSYLVARRIRMHIETWDRTSLAEQEEVIGRSKGEGASPGRAREHDPVILDRMAPDAHVRLAHPDTNGGARMLRRGYSFTDGTDGLGRLDAGLFFLAYQRDLDAFVRVQSSLRGDRLNEYIQHVGSGVYAVPPGVREGGFWGETLFS
ncbi:iron uptake transporter deferrochelatase/peroxidase subunit [Actinocorallia sp. A-T 12471]|uniref:iron uptake transporter deferrochelatase/peroxidase subunit n=1 Tax=Actinocorallia sp. A-T 12471 TaxID=3089813 RepID=UPI0029D3A9AD|nr:iron uptake transporter deferrochelatase/peroxidase subunit [Actinocorallia sp. A-T 12471]MDX6740851.1 iron uptake transporter deferrochelatase/peroxidase subunit [Actinocorallia sp. A-T 12471]